jgi:hypothetical protein
VPAAREEARERRLERLGLEVQRRDVPAEMVDRDERKPARPREPFRNGETHEQRADEAGPLRHADPRDVVEGRSRLVERGCDDRRDELEMPARRDLGDDPAVPGMEVCLRRHDGGEDPPVVAHERGRRLVAGGLDPEDDLAHAPVAFSSAWSASRHMINASSRLSV